ncbi:MAG: trypsin-like peptidase domain-containing protein [Candidatus Dormibacteraceae bacterium]
MIATALTHFGGAHSLPVKFRGEVMVLSELFAELAAKVFVVQALNGRGRVMSFGSGVVVTPDHIVTNKHVIEGATAVRVRHGNRIWPATLMYLDPDHDVCQIKVENLETPPAEVRKYPSLSVGERVYTIGAPEGFELTLSEGLISGLRLRGNTKVIQTTAPISCGSSGGGLFDFQGRLVGITTYSMREGQSLNFAIAADLALMVESHPFTGWLAGQTKAPGTFQSPRAPAGEVPSTDVPTRPAPVAVKVKDLLEVITRAIAEYPGEVCVRALDDEQSTLLELRVHPADLGKVIGKDGRVALSIRTILGDVGIKISRRISLEIVFPD